MHYGAAVHVKRLSHTVINLEFSCPDDVKVKMINHGASTVRLIIYPQILITLKISPLILKAAFSIK